MSKLVFRLIALLLLTALAHIPAYTSDCWEYSKIIKKEFPISARGAVSLSNKFGKIEVQAWDGQRVKIESIILVRASGEAAAQRVFNRINVLINNGPESVNAETIIAPQKRDWWDWGVEEEEDFSISYKVFMPPGAKLIARNKYGDLFVSGIKGRAELSVRYGHLSVEGLFSDSEITLEYGSGMIEKAGRLNVNLERARLIVEDVRLLTMNSRYSVVQMNRVAESITTTKYDTYDVDEAGRFANTGEFDQIYIKSALEVSVDSRLTQLNVGKVADKLRLHIDSSGVRVIAVGRNFKEVDLAGKFTDFQIGIEEGAAYQMNAVADYAGIRYPRNFRVLVEKEHGANHEVQGQAGEGRAPRVLRARLSYGALRVGEE